MQADTKDCTKAARTGKETGRETRKGAGVSMMSQEHYQESVRRVEEKILLFLRTFEDIQENMHFGKIPEAQARLRDTLGDFFETALSTCAALEPSEERAEFHAAFSAALTHLDNASNAFLGGAPGPNFGGAFVNSRFSLCRGLDLLYNQRAHLPTLSQYWLLPEAASQRNALETRSDGVALPVGMIHQTQTQEHAEYSLYVPEYYSPDTDWPLIVCLHGGYGRGDDYIWTWLRPAKSKGYLLLSPKSLGPTWSVLQPPVDSRSIRAMFDTVCETYRVDRSRVYLSGLSDGGTYTYLLGLDQAELFAGIAPIAGELSPAADGMLRQKQGIDVPIHVIHGVHDFIFPVESVRSSNELLEHIGYNVKYTELPDWGHALTYAINETLVLPWFEGLEPKEQS